MKHIYQFFSKCKEKYYLKYITLCSAFLFVGNNVANAQVSTYSFTQSVGNYTPINGTVLATATDNSSGSLNGNVYPLSLPFNFSFNGNSYSSINVSTNGFITFGATAPSGGISSPISGAIAYNGAISAFGKPINSVYNINGVTGNISWETVGVAPNRELVIQWKDFRPASSSSTTLVYTFSFQIRLQETTNAINVIYNSGSYLAGNTAITGTAQIGLRGATTADFNNRLNTTTEEFKNSTSGTANNSSQNFNTVNAVPGMPPAGLIYIWEPPTCYVPSGLLSGATTATTASVSWSASVSSPGGYDIYYSTSNVAPTASTSPMITNVPGTSATLNSLTPATLYYVWVRSNCGGGNTSVWSLQSAQVITQCQPPSVISTTGATVCPAQSATLSATGTSGATLFWYDAATGGNNVATGGSYNTPALTSTTNYWVAAANVGNEAYVGKTTPTSTAGSNAYGDYGLLFDAYTPMVIKEVDVYPMGVGSTGTVTISLKNSSGTVIDSKTVTVNVTTAGVLNTIPLNFYVPASGSNYRLVISASNISTFRREITSGFTYPYTLAGVANITSAISSGAASSTYYYYLYNWKVFSKCESARTMVTATVDAACLGISEANEKEAIKTYPNPFSEIININKPELIKTINVTDMSGKLIRTVKQPEAVLRLQDLSPGLYILDLEMKDDSHQSVKVIKK